MTELARRNGADVDPTLFDGGREQQANGEPWPGNEMVLAIDHLVEQFSEQRRLYLEQRTNLAERQQGELRELLARHEAELKPFDENLQLAEATISALQGKEAPALRARAREQQRAERGTRPPQQRTGVRQSNGTATNFGISFELVMEAGKKIKELVAAKKGRGEDTRVTQKEVYKALDWDQSRGSAAFKCMRALEFLRMDGKVEKAQGWSLMDVDALDKEWARIQEATDRYRRREFGENVEYRERLLTCLRELGGEAEGIDPLARMADVPKHSARDLLYIMESEHEISITKSTKRGEAAHIQLLEA